MIRTVSSLCFGSSKNMWFVSCHSITRPCVTVFPKQINLLALVAARVEDTKRQLVLS